MKRAYLQPLSEVVSLEMERSLLTVSGNIDDVGWGDGEPEQELELL